MIAPHEKPAAGTTGQGSKSDNKSTPSLSKAESEAMLTYSIIEVRLFIREAEADIAELRRIESKLEARLNQLRESCEKGGA